MSPSCANTPIHYRSCYWTAWRTLPVFCFGSLLVCTGQERLPVYGRYTIRKKVGTLVYGLLSLRGAIPGYRGRVDRVDRVPKSLYALLYSSCGKVFSQMLGSLYSRVRVNCRRSKVTPFSGPRILVRWPLPVFLSYLGAHIDKEGLITWDRRTTGFNLV